MADVQYAHRNTDRTGLGNQVLNKYEVENLTPDMREASNKMLSELSFTSIERTIPTWEEFEEVDRSFNNLDMVSREYQYNTDGVFDLRADVLGQPIRHSERRVYREHVEHFEY